VYKILNLKGEKMIKFNKKKIVTGIKSLPYYRVMYKIHPLNEVPDFSNLSFEKYKNDGEACYSGFFREYHKNNSPVDCKWMTSVYMAKPFTDDSGEEFSEKHVVRWIELCTKYKLLPPVSLFKYSMGRLYVEGNKPKGIDEGNYIKLTYTLFVDGVFQPTLYMWLDNFRHLREDQGLVMATLYMHDELGIDFYVAYIIASYFNISNVGHHSLKLSDNDLYNKPPTKASRISNFDSDEIIDLKLASVFYRACNNFYELAAENYESENKLKFTHKSAPERATVWFCNSIHESVCGKEKDLLLPLKHLRHDNVSKIVRAETEYDRQSLLNSIK
jgi:hypothetical protein